MINSKANLMAFGIMAVFSTALAPAMGGDNRNFLVIGLTLLVPLLMLAFRLPLPRDALWVTPIVFYMIVATLFHGVASDLSSVFYTILFVLSYVGFVSTLQTGRVEQQSVIRFLRYLILAFGLVSVLQMVTSLAGLPVPNRILSKGMWSYNSLSAEPSQLGRVLPMSMMAYIVLVRGTPGTSASPWKLLWREWEVVAAFLVSTLLSGSALAILAAPLALLFSFSARWIIALTTALILAWPLVLLIDLPALHRGLAFVAALPTLDIQELADADHSASLRVAPALIYFEKMPFESIEFWLGGGVSAIRPFMLGELIGVGDNVGAGFFPAFLIAFGLVGTALIVWTFVLRFLHPVTLPLIAMWATLFLPSAWNTQLFWYGLMLIRILHHFKVGRGRLGNIAGSRTDHTRCLEERPA